MLYIGEQNKSKGQKVTRRSTPVPYRNEWQMHSCICSTQIDVCNLIYIEREKTKTSKQSTVWSIGRPDQVKERTGPWDNIK